MLHYVSCCYVTRNARHTFWLSKVIALESQTNIWFMVFNNAECLLMWLWFNDAEFNINAQNKECIQ